MSCLYCGCDAWFELKHGLKRTTSADCGCRCHKFYNSEDKFYIIVLRNDQVTIIDKNGGIDLGELR